MSAFKKSSETGKHVRDKILIWGPTHSSKTHAALGWPDPALVDVENRGAHFADRFDFFHAQPRTMDEILEVLDELKTGRLPCQTEIIDSYSAIYEKLVARHTSTSANGNTTTDYATINRRVAPVREFIFSTVGANVIVVAHAIQKYDRNGNNFTKHQGLEFFGDPKFAYGFDYVFQTEPTGDDPRKHAVKFIVKKSASPKLAIGDALVVKPNESLYNIFRSKVSPVVGETPAQPPASTSVQAAPAKTLEGPITAAQLDEIADLTKQNGLGQMEIANGVSFITDKRTTMVPHMEAQEAQRMIEYLHKRLAKGAA